MEHTNPDRKPFSELVKEAEEKDLKIVLVAEPIIDGHHRVEMFIKHDKFMVIKMSNLLEADQTELKEKMGIAEKKSDFGSMGSFVDKMMQEAQKNMDRMVIEARECDDIILTEKENAKTHPLPKPMKPYKGFKNNHKTMFKGHRKH